VLDWGSDETAVNTVEQFNRQGYTFQGYNVYQLPTVSSSLNDAIKLATFDKEGDAIRTIADTVFDVSLGMSIIVVKQKGTDSGIKRQFVITQDKARSAPLVNGQSYYFAVTSYGYNPSSQALTHALESSLIIHTGIPKTTDPGTRYSASPGDSIKVTNTNPGKKSDGAVVATVVDPTKLTGKNYKVTFRIDTLTFSYPSGDVQSPTLKWFLITGTDTVRRGTNQGPTVIIDPGDGDQIGPKNGNLYDYPIADGMFVTVSGPPPLLNSVRTSFTGTDWWTDGSGVGGRFVGGGSGARKLRYMASTGFDMTNYLGAVGSSLDASQYVDVEFRFGDNGSLKQKAYRYNRSAFPGEETGSQYKFMDYSDVPFQVWDISKPASPRQLNVGYRDQDLSGAWEPSGGVEVIFVTKSTYDGNAPTTYGHTLHRSTNNIQHQDVQYVCEWISDNLVASDIKASTIHISPNYVNSASDVFTFKASAGPLYDAGVAKSDVSAINVFPNPYYGFNRAETSRFQRFVTFNHLPKTVEVRIFNIAGALVKALKKDDVRQYMNWDLTNISNLPVASGLYIAHLTLKDASGTDLGTKILKIVIVQEQQYLDNF
jgi:hypothetical protein